MRRAPSCVFTEMSRVYPGHTCAVLTAQGAGTAGRSRGGVRELIAADSGGLGGYKLVTEQQSQRGSRAWRGSEQTALRSMGSDTGSPRLGQLPYQMQVHSQQSRPTHHALMPTLGRPQHSCPAAHPGHSPSDPQNSASRGRVSDRPASAPSSAPQVASLRPRLFGKPRFSVSTRF